MKNVWQLQDAKNQFSRVVENALTKGVQTITRHGKPTVFVISVDDFERKQKPRRSIADLIMKSPLKYLKEPIRRDKQLPREIDL